MWSALGTDVPRAYSVNGRLHRIMNTYAIQPFSPFIPVVYVRAHSASEAFQQILAQYPAVGIWQVKTQASN